MGLNTNIMKKWEAYEKDTLQKLINESTSISEVLKKMNLKFTGANHSLFKKYLSDNHFNLETLVGRSFYRGNSHKIKSLYEILQNGTNYESTKLKNRLLREGILEYKCGNPLCGISEWHGENITLELHHINGNHYDNRLENLILLCPNCHSQTTNYRGKNSNVEEEKNKLEMFLNKAKENANIKLPTLLQEYKDYCEGKISLRNKTRQKHKRIKNIKLNKCLKCGKETSNKIFCSDKCYNEYKSQNKVSSDILLEVSKKVYSLNELKKELNLNISDNALKKWCKGYGIYDEMKCNFKQKAYPIIQYDMNDNIIREWQCGNDIMKELGFNKFGIQKCCRGKQKTSNGFKWKYKNK